MNLFTTMYRACYLTDNSTNKKSCFNICLNSSIKPTCLQSSFSDKELEDYLQLRKCKASKLSKKICCTTGWTSTRWVVGSSTHLSHQPKMRGRFNVKYMCITKAIPALICSDRNVFVGKESEDNIAPLGSKNEEEVRKDFLLFH